MPLSDKIALFPGRFQPLPHLGHQAVLKQIFAQHHKAIIVIGSSNKSGSPEHLLTAAERQEALEALLGALNISQTRYEIIPVPDIDSNPEYVAHLEKFVPQFEVVYSGNPLVQRLFQEAGYEVVPITLVQDISGTKVRELMLAGQEYLKYIPRACQTFVTKFKIVESLKTFSK